ncbi:MAG: integrase core domain-containing protein, partial [Phycisphaeraceae bacterium]|nr:integrase core domain-containing protein [Phycisphaeraceae bacterium]
RKGPGRRRAGRTGRPRKPEEVRALIVRIATETGWGSTRVLGELRKLGITNISRTTVRRILTEHGIDPAPTRRGQSWDEFIKAHAETLWACDFFTKTVWTALGPRVAYVLFFLHIGSRRVIVSEPTTTPTREWTAEQASLFLGQAQADGFQPPGILLRDHDGKFGPAFDSALAGSGCRAKALPVRAPILNAFAERWIQSVKRECLDHIIVFGLGHLAYLITSWVRHYHEERPHQGLDNRLITGPDPPEATVGPIRCRTRLGGVLKSYERLAA